MKREFSAGGVLFKGNEVLLILNPSGVWTFPKGNIEPGETPQQTAVMEVEEETGISGRVVKRIGDITYWYQMGGEKILKKVTYFLMEYEKGEVSPSWEVKDAGFFNRDEVPDLLKYRGDKEIFKKALSAHRRPEPPELFKRD